MLAIILNRKHLFKIEEKNKDYQVLIKWKNKYNCIVTVIVSCAYALMISLRTMPYAEGWYTYYAQCINKGEVVYKDFDYLFTPLYIHFIALFTRIFGYKIIYLRLLGVAFFGLIALFLFLSLKEIFNSTIAMIVTVPTVMYLQSEVAQVFYDYVRLMDLTAIMTVYFLVRFVKGFMRNNQTEKHYKWLVFAGVANSAFILIKQNMGIVFCAYVYILLIAIGIVTRTTNSNKKFMLIDYSVGLIVPIIFFCCIMTFNGSLTSFFFQAGTEAIAAKGGVLAILFGWFSYNSATFVGQTMPAIGVLAIVVILSIIKYIFAHNSEDCISNKIWYFFPPVYFSLALIGFLLLHFSKQFATFLASFSWLSPYSFFLIVITLFFYYVAKTIRSYLKKDDVKLLDLLYITMTGAYFAISWGCGMSSGLSEGQATLGLAFIIALILKSCDFKYGIIMKIVVSMLCLFMILQYGSKKMLYTYNWWGMTDSDYWESTELSKDISLLEGIRMSESTLTVYEDIYRLVQTQTNEGDSIYCFPQIPLFYSLCDRTDPGVRAKVQWFDVASDSSIVADMKVIESNQPKVIIIYETLESAYSAHENIFRSGSVSGTRMMKGYLLDYVNKYEYIFYGRVSSTDNNSFLLYYKNDDDF